MPRINSLREVRERLLGYRFDAVVRLGGIPAERLRAIEDGAAASVYEAEVLSRLYGIESDALVEEPIQISGADAIGVLALQQEFREVADQTRAAIVAAANAARDLVRLRRLEDPADPRARFDQERPRLGPPSAKDDVPHKQGAHLAKELRSALHLGRTPIASVRDLVVERLPSVTLLYARLGSEGPAGLTFADGVRGPAIVLNLDGKNTNACVRRFSLAHEICHLLADWTRVQSLAVLSGFLTESGLARERRANAFAVRLLCPEQALKRLARDASPVEAASALREYGLPYAAIRLYLSYTAGVQLPTTPPAALVGIGTEPRWVDAEEPTGIAGFPIGDVPPERRTAVARVAARMYSLGKLSRGAFAEALGTTPVSELEKVLDFFSLNPPDRASR